MAKDGEMVVSPTLPNRPKAPPRRPGRPHAQARHLHTHETIIASGSVTAGTGGVWSARAVGAHGVGKPTAALPCVFESGVLLENGSGLCCPGGRPRSPLPARPAASTPPGAPRTTHRWTQLVFTQGRARWDPGAGSGAAGRGRHGAPFVGLAVHKKVVSFGSCHWLRGLLPRTLAPRDGLHQTNSRQAPCVLNLNFSKGRQGPGRGGAMHHCGWWARARVLRHQMKRGNEGIFLRFCVVAGSSAVLRPPPPPEGPGAPLTPTTPTRYAVCVAPPKCGTQAMRGWRRGPCAGGCHCQWRFPQRPGIGSPHSTQPLSFVHMSCMHSGPRGLCAQWGAPLSRSHTPAERGPPYPQYVLGRRFWARNVTIA